MLCHEASVTREWINYEAGVGDGQGSLVVPCVIRHFSKGGLKPPISRKQARSLTDADDLTALIRDIADHVKLHAKEVNFEPFLEVVRGLPALAPIVSVEVVPFIGRRTGLNDQIQFELRNAGSIDVELIHLKAVFPDRILDGSWPRPGIPPILNIERANMDGEPHTIGAYLVTDLPIAHGFTPTAQRMPRYLAGKAAVTLREFRFPLTRDISEQHKSAIIRYELAVRSAPVIRGEITLVKLLESPAREF